MKKIVFLLLSVTLRLIAEDPVSLYLMNGNKINGTVHSLEGVNLSVTPAWGGSKLEIPAALVCSLFFQREDEPAPHPANALMHFTNGDQVEAELLSFDGTFWTLNTSWANNLRARGSMVHRIEPLGAGAALLFKGPGDLRHWSFPEQPHINVQPPASWRGNLVLHGRSVAGRPLPDLPPVFSLEFVLEPPAGSHNFFIELFGDRMEGGETTRMHVMFSTGMIFYREIIRTRATRGNWRVMVPRDAFDSDTLRIRFNVNTRENLYQLIVNNILIQEWDGEVFAGNGKDLRGRWARISLQHPQDGTLVLKDLTLREWDGRTHNAVPDEWDPGAPHVQFALANGDILGGELKRFEDGNLVIRPQRRDREISIPLHAMQSIHFPLDRQHRPRAGRRDVLVVPNHGTDRVTLSLERFDPRGVTGTSDLWDGEILIPRKNLRLLSFNVHMRTQSGQVPPSPPPWEILID